MARKQKIKALAVARILEKAFPDARCALHYETPEQLLFATILSAQCTDERVNATTPALFARFPSSRELARARPAEVEKLIYSTGFYKNKARSLIESSKKIQEEHGGVLPRTMEELVRLPGVGRKTANVVLGDVFGTQEGIVVDTHVKRIANLLGLTRQNSPEKIERELMAILPREYWTKFAHWLILHGRRTCVARRPKCGECALRRVCDYGSKEIL
ncbi:MAG: endonuclease III [Bdellovibrionales bacterium]|nr:endonuclease III [Bdellovibrionales bacterium]